MREGFEELNNVVQSLTGIFRHKPTAPSCSKPWFFQHFGGGIFLTHSSPNLLSEISLQQYTFPSFLNLGISTNTHYSPNSPYSKLGFVSAVSWQVLRVDTPSQWRVFMYSAWIQAKKKKKSHLIFCPEQQAVCGKPSRRAYSPVCGGHYLLEKYIPLPWSGKNGIWTCQLEAGLPWKLKPPANCLNRMAPWGMAAKGTHGQDRMAHWQVLIHTTEKLGNFQGR